MLPSRFFHIAKALLDDARGEEEPALTELFECIGKERDDDVSNNVCHNEIGLFIGIIEEIALFDRNPVGKVIFGNIFLGHFHSLAVNINGMNGTGAHKRGRHGKDPASCTDVIHIDIGRDQFLKAFDTHPRCSMRSRTKGHTGIKFDDFFFRRRGLAFPIGFDDNLTADLRRMEILLPFIGPIFFTHLTEAELTYLEAANSLFYL